MSITTLRQDLSSEGSFGISVNECRRAAWLHVLGVPLHPIAKWQKSKQWAEDNDETSIKGAKSADHTPALTSSSSSDNESSGPSTSDLMSSSIQQGVSLDAEGWQTGFESAIFQDRRSREPTSNTSFHKASPSFSRGDWQTAQSKRSRRKGQRRHSNRASGDDASNGSEFSQVGAEVAALQPPSMFESAVDVEGERPQVPTIGSSESNGEPSATSSAIHTQANTMRQRNTTGSVASGTLFDQLPMEGEEDKGRNARKKRNKNAAQTSATPARPSPSHSSEVGEEHTHSASGKPHDSDALYKLSCSYSEHLSAHRDERQVELDINRSFVGIKCGSLATDAGRLGRRRQLQDVIVGVLRRHPALNYYQGYHDIISVIILVLSPADPPASNGSEIWASEEDFKSILTATTRLTLHYLRDFMAPKMDPCLGWLKTLRNIVRQENEELSRTVLEEASPLPYFALSWTITVLAHELPVNSEEIRQIFDHILLFGPRVILYILAALVITQTRQSIAELGDGEELQDPAMLHHSLSKLPDLLSQDAKQREEAKSSDNNTTMSQVLQQARRLMSQEQDHQSIINSIMGPSSVLLTYSSSSRPTSESPIEWQRLNSEAESHLSDPTRIVLNPNPTPPSSEYGDDDEKKPTSNRRSQRRTVANTGAAAVVISVIFIAGMAVLIGPAGLMTSQTGSNSGSALGRNKLIKDLTELGRGLAGAALCAAGVC
ncbi:unnamed protein product [Sympodiomycopsis kandeliae]